MSGPPKGTSTFSVRQRALQRDLARLIEHRYGDLSTEEMTAVFTRVMGERAAQAAEPALRSWSRAGQRYFFGRQGGHQVLALEPQSAVAFAAVQSDIKVNRAMMAELPEPLPLNSDLVVCVILSIVDLEIWYRGRVVHATPTGNALTLEPLSEQHATWWEVARRAFSSGVSQPSMPRTGPKTAPPRVMRSSGTHTARTSSPSGGPRSSKGTSRSRNTRSSRTGPRSGKPLSRSAPRPPSRPYSRGTAAAPRSTGITGVTRPVDTAALYRRMRAKKARLGVSDHFEMLDLHWSAFSELINKAYERDRAQLRIEHFPAEKQSAVADDLKAIQAALKTAYEAIVDDKKRRRYREGQVNAFQIQSAVELYMDKGNTALMRKDPIEASECFKRVLELDPEHMDARSRLGTCKRRG